MRPAAAARAAEARPRPASDLRRVCASPASGEDEPGRPPHLGRSQSGRSLTTVAGARPTRPGPRRPGRVELLGRQAVVRTDSRVRSPRPAHRTPVGSPRRSASPMRARARPPRRRRRSTRSAPPSRISRWHPADKGRVTGPGHAEHRPAASARAHIVGVDGAAAERRLDHDRAAATAPRSAGCGRGTGPWSGGTPGGSSLTSRPSSAMRSSSPWCPRG